MQMVKKNQLRRVAEYILHGKGQGGCYVSLKLLAFKRKEAFYSLREKTGQGSLRQLAGSVFKDHTNVHCAIASREQTHITWPRGARVTSKICRTFKDKVTVAEM